MNTAALNHRWGTLAVEELVRNGVTLFCIAPGSRSTPLAVAAGLHPRVRTVVHFDERGLAFFALGYARATGRPAAVVTTSGTAAANLLPAAVEASLDLVPLLLLTADRPPELQKTGANQTIDQPHLYGDYPRWHLNLPCPDENLDPAILLTAVDQAVYRSIGSPAGPVHLNFQFREPLWPAGNKAGTPLPAHLKPWGLGHKPFTRYFLPSRKLDPKAAKELAGSLNAAKRGLLIIGGLKSREEQRAAMALAEKLSWPVFADITSGIKPKPGANPFISHFELLLHSKRFLKKFRPDLVLQIGGRVVSKRLAEHLKSLPNLDYRVVLDHPFRADPLHRITERYEGNLPALIRQISGIISTKKSNTYISSIKLKNDVLETFLQISGIISTKKSNTYISSIKLKNDVLETFLIKACANDSALDEISAVRILCGQTGAGMGLYLASSMPIRDTDAFGCFSQGPATVAAGRGASGIDGTVAAAAGYAFGLGKPTALLTGDLALLHDLNSLALLKNLRQPFALVAVNNDGGGIFSFLSIAGNEKVFEKYFGTPHGLGFKEAARMFGLHYRDPRRNGDFAGALSAAVRSPSPTVIEIRTRRGENLARHQAIWRKVEAALARG